MLTIIAPAKRLDYQTPPTTDESTEPEFLSRSEELVAVLKKKSPKQIAKLMGVSEKLAQENHDRYQAWENPMPAELTKQAIFAFKGDVYLGLEAESLTRAQLRYAQEHLRILSGLYGVLRPLDAMLPYRLEMGTDLKTPRGKNLYAFWGSMLTDAINRQLVETGDKVVLNLASKEYFQSLNAPDLDAKVVTPVFKNWNKGKYKVLSFFAKKARGTMAAWVIRNKAKTLKKLKQFDCDGYRYDEASSTDDEPVFLRD